MKKAGKFFAGLLAAACFSAGCENEAKPMTFKVGFDADFPPYGYFEQGEYRGLDLDLAREVCRRCGWTLVAVPINWDAKDMELESSAIDCIWNGFTIDGRENVYEWSEPYIDNSQVIMVRRDAPIATSADLAGKSVAAQTDTPVLKALSPRGKKAELGRTFKKLVVTPSYRNAIMELDSGAVDAVAMDVGVARREIAAAPGKFRLLPQSIMSEKYGIGFRKGNHALRDRVQTTLKEIILDGTAAQISARYFDGENVLLLRP